LKQRITKNYAGTQSGEQNEAKLDWMGTNFASHLHKTANEEKADAIISTAQ
jgi:hypothetical protein